MAGIIIAFKNVNFSIGIFNSPWCGLQNFSFLFRSSDAMIITRNTILYNLLFIFLNTFLAVLLAVCLNEVRKKKLLKTFQTCILLPYLISMVIVAYLVYAALSYSTGFINKGILNLLNIDSVDFYNNEKYWPFILPIVNAWKNVGYLCIVYFASIIGVGPELYEAAELDGASRWNQIRYITLPLLKPTIIMIILFSLGRIFNSDFGLFYQVPMDSGTIYNTTNTIDTYVYRALMQLGDIGMSSAAGVYQSAVGFILVMVVNKVVKHIDSESALF